MGEVIEKLVTRQLTPLKMKGGQSLSYTFEYKLYSFGGEICVFLPGNKDWIARADFKIGNAINKMEEKSLQLKGLFLPVSSEIGLGFAVVYELLTICMSRQPNLRQLEIPYNDNVPSFLFQLGMRQTTLLSAPRIASLLSKPGLILEGNLEQVLNTSRLHAQKAGWQL